MGVPGTDPFRYRKKTVLTQISKLNLKKNLEGWLGWSFFWREEEVLANTVLALLGRTSYCVLSEDLPATPRPCLISPFVLLSLWPQPAFYLQGVLEKGSWLLSGAHATGSFLYFIENVFKDCG